MLLHPQPQPVLDLVANCNTARIEYAQDVAASVRRSTVLQKIFSVLTENCRTDLEKIQACLYFTQLHYFHHFAGQPMQSSTLAVFDPLVILLTGFARCGNLATFLADLFLCNGFAARTIGAAGHTSCEVYCEDRWILVDASLYPPGIYPRNEQGAHLSFEEAIKSPSLLDQVPSYINYHHEYINHFLSEYPEVAEAIEKYLRKPILPSSAFFGASFYSEGRVPSQVDRYIKTGSPVEWDKDPNFGWLSYQVEGIQGPLLATRFRPAQIEDLRLDDDYLTWDEPLWKDADQTINYRLTISKTPRKWSYQAIPLDCNFEIPGSVIRISTPKIPFKEVLELGRFLTITTEVKEWESSQTFYLPSLEFDLLKLKPSLQK